jgi:hypothetical protein
MVQEFNVGNMLTVHVKIPPKISTVGSWNTQAVAMSLIQMFDDTSNENLLDPQELWKMHERVLLLSSFDEKRGKLLNLLGDLCFQKWKVSHILGLRAIACAWQYSSGLRL